ncbi:MAG: hypothetical protein ACTH8F_11905 [Microbacterium sp.]|uniref:hypothetical protein n=1 Tax=Microbacterium sp. TaxID=51671 RepID=UPI003F9D0616
MKLSWWQWALIALAVGVVGWVLIVHNSSDGLSTRIGSWAQLLAALGTLGAAWLALKTAKENREQAETANRALTAATRPLMSLHLLPQPKSMKHCEPDQPVSLSVSNNSPFDAPKCRVSWTTKHGQAKVEWLDQLSADVDSSVGFSDGVSHNNGAKSSVYVPLGSLKDWNVDDAQIMFFYASPFHNGGWMEVHRWRTWNTSSDTDMPPHYEQKHTASAPIWMTLGDIGF